MSAASQPIALSEELLEQAARQANRLGVTTEQWIETALAEKIRLEKATADFFQVRAARASGRKLGEILDRAGDNPPGPGDEL